MATLPLLDPTVLADNLTALGPEILAVLKAAADAFVEEHRQDVLVVGEENARAILASMTYVNLPIAPLPADAPLAQLATHEETLTKRDQLMQLIAQAQREGNEHEKRLYAAASKAAGTTALGILGLGLKALLGG